MVCTLAEPFGFSQIASVWYGFVKHLSNLIISCLLLQAVGIFLKRNIQKKLNAEDALFCLVQINTSRN